MKYRIYPNSKTECPTQVWSDSIMSLKEVTDLSKKELAKAFAFAPKKLVKEKKIYRKLRPIGKE